MLESLIKKSLRKAKYNERLHVFFTLILDVTSVTTNYNEITTAFR